ncbi:unnamed protein product [Dimorphilus gyrociliatus]|uniref:non-specific serine/threonine protein kinase n=1 Tax=Dimorphilus gyrociliatus TaxID=2664684 RepID=A0A7I8V904_9ANNE|nr:unnamed protein product [Dimorphilus gyrociliatus]
MGSVKKRLKKCMKFGENYNKYLLNFSYLESLDERDILIINDLIILKSQNNPFLDKNGTSLDLQSLITKKYFGNNSNSSVFLQNMRINDKDIIKKVYKYSKKAEAEMEISVLVRMNSSSFFPDVYAIKFGEYNISIFMKKIEHSLQNYCYKKDLNFFQLRCIFRDVLAAVSSLHKEGIVHEDIKADNIVIERCFRGGKHSFKGHLIDFGLSQYECCRRVYYESGNVLTSSPEKVNCKGERCNYKLDIWSIGISYLQAKLRSNLIYPLKEPNRFNCLLHIGQLRNLHNDAIYETLQKFRSEEGPVNSSILNYFPKLQTLHQMEIEFLKATLAIDPSKRKSANEILQLDLFYCLND